MKIGELAERTGASVRSLRYYEAKELLASTRTPGGHRVYQESDVDRILLVRHLFEAGLTSADVVELLPCIYSGTTSPRMLELLVRERERIGTQTQQLLATLDRLDVVIAEARVRLSRPA